MKQLTAIAIVLATTMSMSAYAAGREHLISVTGKAEETVKPDVAYVTVYGQADGILMIDAVKKNARVEANKSAALAGKKAGDVVTIGCAGSSHFNFGIRVMGRKADFPTEHIGINPKEITVPYTVTVSFELKEKD